MNIAHAIAGTPPAPCDTCPAYKICADECLACGQYRHYVCTGKIRRDIPMVPMPARIPAVDDDSSD